MKQPYSGMDLIYDFKEDPATEHMGRYILLPVKSERMVIDALDAVPMIKHREGSAARAISASSRYWPARRRHKPPLEFFNLTVDP